MNKNLYFCNTSINRIDIFTIKTENSIFNLETGIHSCFAHVKFKKKSEIVLGGRENVVQVERTIQVIVLNHTCYNK